MTFHGPGQCVCYPVFHLRDLQVGARAFVKGLEESVVTTVGAWGLHAAGDPASSAGVRPPSAVLCPLLLATRPPQLACARCRWSVPLAAGDPASSAGVRPPTGGVCPLPLYCAPCRCRAPLQALSLIHI